MRRFDQPKDFLSQPGGRERFHLVVHLEPEQLQETYERGPGFGKFCVTTQFDNATLADFGRDVKRTQAAVITQLATKKIHVMG
jgi:hypothetical protein